MAVDVAVCPVLLALDTLVSTFWPIECVDQCTKRGKKREKLEPVAVVSTISPTQCSFSSFVAICRHILN